MARHSDATRRPARSSGNQQGAQRNAAAADHTTMDAVEEKVVNYAENLGRAIGTVRARMDSWSGEREQLINQLSSAVSEAQQLLTDLGHRAERQARRITAAATTGRATANESASPARGQKGMAGGPDAKKHRLPGTTRRRMSRRK